MREPGGRLHQLSASLAAGAFGAAAAAFAVASLVGIGSGWTEHAVWYVNRAAGLAAYLFIALSLAIGAFASSAIGDGAVARSRLLAAHQTAGYGGLMLALAHALVLLLDEYVGFTLRELFLPYASDYAPQRTALGVISLYLLAISVAAFWLRRQLGRRLWRWLHLCSVIAFAGSFVHGVYLGTDTATGWAEGIYLAGVFLVVSGLVVRLAYRRPQPRGAPNPQRA